MRAPTRGPYESARWTGRAVLTVTGTRISPRECTERGAARTETTEWETLAEYYDGKQGETGDLWHRALIDPGLFDLLGELPTGCRVLDLACGNGYISRRLARAGASVVGVDLGKRILELARAREAADPLGITYLGLDAAHLDGIGGATFDVVVANMSLMDIEDASGALREVGRVLRPGGRFVASVSHPCFDTGQAGWAIERFEYTTTVYRKVSAYRESTRCSGPWRLDDGTIVRTPFFHRPLAWYAEELVTSGLLLRRLREPAPTPEMVGPGATQADWIRVIPLHLVFEAVRVQS
ncbi:MAG: class I SAM-dependent methyltransferase [Thermoplasmata archaeon]|nr:class I SAM-dependent methyltransferase [Thermoplasmata archaeon]